MAPFETSSDIIEYLQEQWSGLFQRLLRDDARRKEANLLDDLKATATTLNQLVTFLTQERRAGDRAIRDILLTNHPIFEEIRKKVSLPHRVFFSNKRELISLLAAWSYSPVESDKWDDDSQEEWLNGSLDPSRLLKIAINVFDEDGKLRIFTPDEWEDDWVSSQIYPAPPPFGADDDLPF